jgi:hypothetical protein
MRSKTKQQQTTNTTTIAITQRGVAIHTSPNYDTPLRHPLFTPHPHPAFTYLRPPIRWLQYVAVRQRPACRIMLLTAASTLTPPSKLPTSRALTRAATCPTAARRVLLRGLRPAPSHCSPTKAA